VHPLTLLSEQAQDLSGIRAVDRPFTAAAPNVLWLTDITEHWTGEGKRHLCAIEDVCSGRIVGCSIDSRMKASLAPGRAQKRQRPPRSSGHRGAFGSRQFRRDW
jgi:transposase InsO family protein